MKLVSPFVIAALMRCGAAQTAPLPMPATAPAPPGEEAQLPADPAAEEASPNVQPLDPAIDAVLKRLEQGAAGLTAFTADITYQKIEAILDRKELRTGQLIYRVQPADLNASVGTGPTKSFAALFDTTVVNGRKRQAKKHYIFSGRWLVEVDHDKKQFIKREIVPPGETLDPLKLGEGPFPLPIGQSRDEVIKRFTVQLIEAPADGLLKDLRDVDGLRLTPRVGTTEAEDYTQVDLFYDRKTSLPVGIVASQTNGDVKTVRLREWKRNPKLGDSELRKLDINEPDPREWRVDVQPWTNP